MNQKNMQRLLLVLGLLFSFSLAYAQDVYVVQQVKGAVKVANELVKPGDKLQSTASLTFATGAMLLVSSQQYGATVLKPKADNIETEASMLLSELLPQQMRASTKSGLVLCNPSDFSSFFGNSTFRVYGKQAAIHVCALAYPLDPTHFFYVVCEDSNREMVNIALTNSEKAFILDMASIEEMTNTNKPKQMTLYYYNSNLEESSEMTAFQLQFVNAETKADEFETFEREAKAVVELLQTANASKKDILQNLTQLGNQYFGPCNKDNLEEWLQENFGIE